VGVAAAPKINFDLWRENYDQYSFEDMKAFYAEVAEKFPDQQHFDLNAIRAAFSCFGAPVSVVELGGWDGALADKMFNTGKVASWRNFDIADVPQVCKRDEYSLVVLDDWFWNGPVRYADVFVATHTVEHIRATDLGDVFDSLHVDYIYLEAPLEDYPTDWTGYHGSHILEIGWDGIDEMLLKRGFAWLGRNDWARIWKNVRT